MCRQEDINSFVLVAVVVLALFLRLCICNGVSDFFFVVVDHCLS